VARTRLPQKRGENRRVTRTREDGERVLQRTMRGPARQRHTGSRPSSRRETETVPFSCSSLNGGSIESLGTHCVKFRTGLDCPLSFFRPFSSFVFFFNTYDWSLLGTCNPVVLNWLQASESTRFVTVESSSSLWPSRHTASTVAYSCWLGCPQRASAVLYPVDDAQFVPAGPPLAPVGSSGGSTGMPMSLARPAGPMSRP
jgi:hypothetical protein